MLQEELWSIRLAVASSLQPTTSQQLWGTLYSQLEQRLLSGVGIAFPHIGVFTTQQEREFIALLPDGRRYLIPPRLALQIYPSPSVLGGERSLSLIFLREALSHTTKLRIELIDKWIDRIPRLWRDLLETGGSVTWPRMGSFEALRAEGSSELVGYTFTPHQSFAEGLNKPFCMFSPIEVSVERSQLGLEIREMKSLEEIKAVRPITIYLPREESEEERRVQPSPQPEPTQEPLPSEPIAPPTEVPVEPQVRYPRYPEDGIPDTSEEDTRIPQPPLAEPLAEELSTTHEEPVGEPLPQPIAQEVPAPTAEPQERPEEPVEEHLPTFDIATKKPEVEAPEEAEDKEPETFEIIPDRRPLSEIEGEAEQVLPVFDLTPTPEPTEGTSEVQEEEPETFAIHPTPEPTQGASEAQEEEPETFAIHPTPEPEERVEETKPQEELPPIVPPAPEVETAPQEVAPEAPRASEPKTRSRQRPNYYVWIIGVTVLLLGILFVIFFLSNRQKKEGHSSKDTPKSASHTAPIVVVPSSMDIIPDSLSLPADTLEEHTTDSLPEPAATPQPEQKPKEEPKEATPRRVITSETRQVQVQEGDRLTLFALKKYGHKAFWVYIYQENKSKIKDPNNLPVGITIVLPDAKKYEINPRDTNSINKALELQHSLRRE